VRQPVSLPPADASLALRKGVGAPCSTAASCVGRGPGAIAGKQVHGGSILAAYGAISPLSRAARTCRWPRCLRRDWQSDASTSGSRGRGFPGRSTAGWRRTGRARSDPDLPRSARGTSPGEHGRRRDQAGISQCYGRSRSVSASVWPVVVETRGLWASGGVGTVRISFVSTFWSSRPLWASHSRFGALSLTF